MKFAVTLTIVERQCQSGKFEVKKITVIIERAKERVLLYATLALRITIRFSNWFFRKFYSLMAVNVCVWLTLVSFLKFNRMTIFLSIQTPNFSQSDLRNNKRSNKNSMLIETGTNTIALPPCFSNNNDRDVGDGEWVLNESLAKKRFRGESKIRRVNSSSYELGTEIIFAWRKVHLI